MKTIYYLSGLPRAGNTLLSSILNQNPKINTTGYSYLNGLIASCTTFYKKSSTAENFPDQKSFDNAMSSMIQSYYKDWSGDIIIQRSQSGLFNELEVINKYLNQDFKCIVLVRDIYDVIASYVKLWKENPDFFLNKDSHSFSTDESKIKYLMDRSSIIKAGLECIYNLYYGWYDKCLFIQYNDLVNNTEKEIKKIYNFLGIEPFEHFYKNIEQFSSNNLKYDDTIYGKNLHEIRVDKIQIKDNSYYKNFIPEDVIQKLKYESNWLNGI